MHPGPPSMPGRLLIRLRLLWGALALHMAAGPALAQDPPRTLLMVLPREELNIEVAFRDYLTKRKLPVQVQTLRFSGRNEDGPALVAQVRRAAPDLIYAWGTTTTLALAGAYDTAWPQNFIRGTPIVFTEVTDPIGTRLLQQLNPPGRNVTGVSHVAPLPVQLNAIHSYRPFTRLGYLTNPQEPHTRLVLHALRQLADTMKFEIAEEVLPLDGQGNPDAGALPAMIRRLAAQKADFLYVAPSTFLALTHRDLVTQSALEAGLPTFCATEGIVRQAKCLFGLFSNGSSIGRFAAYKAVQVLAEKTPVANIPVETLPRFSLLINMPTARALQLYPPLGLLNVAEVIE